MAPSGRGPDALSPLWRRYSPRVEAVRFSSARLLTADGEPSPVETMLDCVPTFASGGVGADAEGSSGGLGISRSEDPGQTLPERPD
jgi:hypothetical protein